MLLQLEELVRQQVMPMHLHAHSIVEVHVDVEAFELLSHVDSRIVVGH